MSRRDKRNNKLSDSLIEAQRLHLEFSFFERVNFKDRQICLSEDIETESFVFINASLTELESINNEPITIIINSYGGSYYEALAIVGRIRKSPCKIITEGYGKMMSAGFLILSAGHQRRASRYSWGMFHNLSTSQPHMPAHYIEADVRHLMVEVDQMCDMLGRFTKKPKRFWNNLTKKPDTYLSPEQLLQCGVVDELF